MAHSDVDGIGVRSLVRLALEEDAPYGDMSARYSVPDNHQSLAHVIAREPLYFCGAQLIPIIFEEFASDLQYQLKVADGSYAKDGECLLSLEGSTRAILQIERPLLNFLQRLCGVSTFTAEIVAHAHGITILDTRKTMPGWRVLEKYSTRVGGAKNHRFSLSDMIVIKNNHIDAHGGSVPNTLRHIVLNKPRYLPFQVEVRSLEELKAVIPFSPTAVMLDNMADVLIEQCLAMLKAEAPQILVEVSGGITMQRLAAFAKIGVPAVSMGALTTAARNRDISLRIQKSGASGS